VSRKYVKRGDCINSYYYQSLVPKCAVSSLVIVHGYAEHSSRYLWMALGFARRGFHVHMMDLSGMGYSGANRLDQTIQDLHQVINKPFYNFKTIIILKDVSFMLSLVDLTLPLFLYGHSMGGGLVLTLLENNTNINLSGVIITSPLLNVQGV
jgi:acylglycerol lipase